MSNNSSMWFNENHVYVGHKTWNDLVGNESSHPLFNVLETFKSVVARNGAAMILMADESSIARRMDCLSEVQDVALNANAKRVALGLTPVSLQELGL